MKDIKKYAGLKSTLTTFLTSAVSGCVSISAFASLFVISVKITCSAEKLKNCSITSGNKK